MESELEKAMVKNSWNNPMPIPDFNEFLLMKDSANIEYHQMGQILSVKRGVDDGEEAPVDHLIKFGDKIDDSGRSSRTQKVRIDLKCLFFILLKPTISDQNAWKPSNTITTKRYCWAN
jgi:hypothetical protein